MEKTNTKQEELDQLNQGIANKKAEIEKLSHEKLLLLAIKIGKSEEEISEMGFSESEIGEARKNIDQDNNKVKEGEEITSEEQRVSKPLELNPNLPELYGVNNIEKDNIDNIKEKTSSDITHELEKIRGDYLKQLKKSWNNRKEDISKAKIRNTVFNTLAVYSEKNNLKDKIKDSDYKLEDYYTEACKELKLEYDKTRIELGNKLIEEKTKELTKLGFSGKELEEALERYKTVDVFNKVVVDEKDRFIQEKARANRNAFIKGWNWYKNLPKKKKVALNTVLFLPFSAATGLGGAIALKYGISALAGTKFLTSMATGAITTGISGKGFDLIYNERNLKFQKSQDQKSNNIIDKYVKGEITKEQYNDYKNALNKEARIKFRNQAIIKAVTSVGLGMAVGRFTYSELGNAYNHIDSSNIAIGTRASVDNTYVRHNNLTDETLKHFKPAEVKSSNPIVENKTDSTNINKIHITTISKPPISTTEAILNNKISIDHSNFIEATVGKGHGAIQTIRELQKSLRAQYGMDISKAPSSVQHILNTSPTKLAEEYGMYRPNEIAESALTKQGDQIIFDKTSGNISFHRLSTDHTTILEKGTEIKGDHSYNGKMIDTDHHQNIIDHTKHSSTELNKNNYRSIPEADSSKNLQSDQIDKSVFLSSHSQPIPEGTNPSNIEIDKEALVHSGEINNIPIPKGASNNIDTDSLIKLTPSPEIKTENMPIDGSVISPTHGIYNTGGESTIYPHQDFYQTPATSNPDTFTREVPMTNQELKEQVLNPLNTRYSPTIENNASIDQSSIDVNNIHNGFNVNTIESDPRHLENIAEVRETFGRSNVVINKPNYETINGIKYTDWDKASDATMKDVRFNSYEQFSKEKILQEFFGRAKEDIENVRGVGNEDVIRMTYFRNDPSLLKVVNEVPAKDFFNNDFRDLPQTDLDTLVRGGVIHDELITSGGLPSHHYIFNNHDDLMRLSKTYSKLVPKVERVLANDKPIGNENMESYIERITKKVYQTDDGTLYGLKDGVNWEERVTRSFNNSRNVYGNTTYPTMGIYPGSNYYSPNRAMASRVVNNIIMNNMTNRWTH